jgi:predicted short-subunit dehydrogenase-like oxidoreductase (DUF2520 family)
MGRLGSALARRLVEAGYRVSTINSRHGLHRRASAKVDVADVVWFCVPDSEIARAAERFVVQDLNAKYAFHSSGVLDSDVLAALRTVGASVASVHPLMTFVRRSVPELAHVPFAIEGEAPAVRVARRIVRDLGGEPVSIRTRDKVVYHAFATMICPLLVSLLATAEKTTGFTGISEREARRRMMPIIRQTLHNYEKLGPAGAFSGPLVRGDVETVRAHLRALASQPTSRTVYVALAKAALQNLPSANRNDLALFLKKNSSANSA